MKHLSSILLAAAFVATGVTACFKDPTSDSLSNGPTRIELTRTAITLRTGDSVTIEAEVKDAAGNVYSAAGAEWSSGDATIAIARLDTTLIPGSVFSRAFIRAVAAGGGVTDVTVSVGGVTNQLRVLVLPARLTASASAVVSGTAHTDTIVNVIPGGTIVRDIFTAGDTVTFTMLAGSNLTFDPTASLVGFGAARPLGYVLRTATQIKAIVDRPFRGRPWVTRLTQHGTAETGDIALDSIQSDSVVVARFPRLFRGTVTLQGDTVVVDAPTGGSFSVVAPLSGARFGARAAWLVGRTATQLRLLSPIAGTRAITLTNQMVGTALIDTLYTPATYTTTIPSFGGAFTQLGDTMFVAAPTGTTFDTLLSGARIRTRAAWVVARTATQLKLLWPRDTTGVVTVTNLHVGLATVDSLKTLVTYTTPPIPTFGGTITQLGDTLTIVPATGTVFDAAAATARFGPASAVVISRTAAELRVWPPQPWAGVVTVTGVKVGAATIDSLKTTASYTLGAATFAGTVTTGGRMLDTVRVYAGTGYRFSTATGSVSDVIIGGVAAWVLVRTADSMYVIAKRPSTGPIGVTNSLKAGVLIPPALLMAGDVVITEMPSGELNEPANDVPGAVVISLDGKTAANPLVIYGVVNDASDFDDYFAFTLTASKTVTVQVQFTGTGAAGTATNPDLDMYTCNATCSGGYNYAGATGAQPENLSGTFAAGTYNITVEGYSTGGTTRAYKLIVYTN